MTRLALRIPETAAPAKDEAPGDTVGIDRAHLARITFGDRALERELLQLFDRQASVLLARMRDGEAAALAGLAHTLKGSAVGIGAGGVAEAAADAERAAGGSPAERSAAIDRLAAAFEAARPAIAALLAD